MHCGPCCVLEAEVATHLVSLVAENIALSYYSRYGSGLEEDLQNSSIFQLYCSSSEPHHADIFKIPHFHFPFKFGAG